MVLGTPRRAIARAWAPASACLILAPQISRPVGGATAALIDGRSVARSYAGRARAFLIPSPATNSRSGFGHARARAFLNTSVTAIAAGARARATRHGAASPTAGAHVASGGGAVSPTGVISARDAARHGARSSVAGTRWSARSARSSFRRASGAAASAIVGTARSTSLPTCQGGPLGLTSTIRGKSAAQTSSLRGDSRGRTWTYGLRTWFKSPRLWRTPHST